MDQHPLRRRITATFVVTALLVAACGGGDDADEALAVAEPAAEGEGEMSSLTIGYSAWPGWFPLAVAEEQGIFEEAGLDVELEYFVDYTTSLDALVAGQVDVNAQTDLPARDGQEDHLVPRRVGPGRGRGRRVRPLPAHLHRGLRRGRGVSHGPSPVTAVREPPAATAATRPVASSHPVPASTATRGRAQTPLWRIGGTLGPGWRVGLGVAGVAVVLLAWQAGAGAIANPSVLPTPAATLQALAELWGDGTLVGATVASARRIAVGFGISVAVGVVVGVAIGTFASVEGFFEGNVAFLRYIPASALTPVFLLWLGIGESPKVWLIVAGTVFFNILMMADVARAVPAELVNAAYTLGAGRLTVLRRVVLRHAAPGLVDAARVNLAAAWLMLVVAELLAADSGLAYEIVRAQRFRAVDTMFALLVVFGIIGLASDLFLRWLRNRSAPWAQS